MMYALFGIIGIALILMLRYLDGTYGIKESDFGYGYGVGIGCMISLVSFIYALDGYTPSAQDVVDGKTTLKITYTDGVPTDTLVVLKNEYKHINWW